MLTPTLQTVLRPRIHCRKRLTPIGQSATRIEQPSVHLSDPIARSDPAVMFAHWTLPRNATHGLLLGRERLAKRNRSYRWQCEVEEIRTQPRHSSMTVSPGPIPDQSARSTNDYWVPKHLPWHLLPTSRQHHLPARTLASASVR